MVVMDGGELLQTLILTFLLSGFSALFWGRLNRLERRIDDGLRELRTEFHADMAALRAEFREEMLAMRADLTQVALAVGVARPRLVDED